MYRKTWMEVNLDAIVHNVRYTKDLCRKKYIAVLKADAYGCGDIQVMNAVLEGGADMIAVSSLDEAMMLRNGGYDGKLLILGATDAEDVSVIIQNHISIAAYSNEWIQEVIQHDIRGLFIHLAVDTGMNRIGFKNQRDLMHAFSTLKEHGCIMEGIFTHFYCSDQKDHVLTNRQFALFKEAVNTLDYPFEWIHCDNSDATIFFKDDLSNACRVGISLYGISPYSDQLQNAISLYTEVAMTKNVNASETIGYGATYTTTSKECIATLPIGYADGLVRKNQNRLVYVDGQFAPIVGRICMDQCMIRLSKNVKPGTVVEIFGPHISLEKMAEELDTIPYEIICLITDRVTRRYIYHNQLLTETNSRLFKSQYE